MLRRLLCLAVAAAAAVVLLAVPANSQGPANQHHQFWGTYLHKVEGMSVPALVTIQFGGTLNVSSGFMFGGGYPMRLSPIHGVWEQTGPKSITATSLFFLFDGNGVMTGYQRNRCPMKFSDDFNSYKGVEFMETVACGAAGCPDPLDPTTVWTPMQGMPATGFPVSGGRLQLVPATH
jgi:hypothetical protein